MNLRFLTLAVGLVAGLVSHQALAQVAEPIQGGEVNLVRATATTMELTFGTRGNGQGRVLAMVITNSGQPIPITIINNQAYAASTVYGQGSSLGQGFAVYNGTGHAVTVTGLQPGKFYYIADAEYNAGGSYVSYNTRGSSMSAATKAAAPTPLPVDLTSFTGSVDDRGLATLQWATVSERNTNYFAIERSTNGNLFNEASRAAAAGNSSQPLTYQWPDAKRLVQPTYYRLRQTDLDGEVHYSAVVLLVPHQAKRIEVYPNPSAGHPVQLLLQGFENETVALHLSDALGRPVLVQQLTPAMAYYLSSLSLPTGLAAGTYFLTLTGNGSPVQKRIIVSD